MAARTARPIPTVRQQEVNIQLDDFRGGLLTLTDESITPANAARVTRNLWQVGDGRYAPRPGTAYYGIDWGGVIEGAAQYVTDSNTRHIVAAVRSGGNVVIKRSTDDGATISTVSGGTFAQGYPVYFLQIKSFLYLSNGNGNVLRYDGSTTLQSYAGLTAPGAPNSLTPGGLTGTIQKYYYRYSAVNEVGETPAGANLSIAVGKQRDSWIVGTDYVDMVANRVTNARRYNIYLGDESGFEVYLTSVADPGTGTTFTFRDTGETALNTFIEYPVGDTTTGPKIGPSELSGNRIWATGDPNNQWRVYWTGTGTFQGAFSPFYGGGYIDLEKGGRERPTAVIHSRDGKGTPYATVFTSDAEGYGSIWQIGLETLTVGETSFTVPNAVKIVGSVGSVAPKSVIKVRDDIMFFNKKGIFTLRAKPQLLNLLSTDEYSANIRPDIQALTGSALDDVAAHFWNAKVLFSVPFGSTTNNRIYVNDTERRNWYGPWTPATGAWSGINNFFEYTNANGNTYLLGIPINGTRLVRFGEDIRGDLGNAFPTEYQSGLIHVTKDRFTFAEMEKAQIEISQSTGTITFQILGTEYSGGFSAVASQTIATTASNVGWSSGRRWSTGDLWSETHAAPQVFAQSSLKRTIYLNGKFVNNLRFRVTTNTLDAYYVLNTLAARGVVSDIGEPSDWRLT